MNKRGFVFIETVIVVIVLTSSLLLLYTTFTKTLQGEKTKINYDDVNYIYRTYGITNLINNLNIIDIESSLDNSNNYYSLLYKKGSANNSTLFNSNNDKINIFNNMMTDYEVEEVILLVNNRINNYKRCNPSCPNDISNSMKSYLKSLYIDIEAVYSVVVEYNVCNNNNICKNYYSWVGI